VERAESGTASDVWLLDAATGAATRLTSASGLDRLPQWSPDGGGIVFASNRTGRYELMRRRASGASAETPLATTPRTLLKWPSDWGAQGSLIAYSAFDARTGYDVWLRAPGDSCRRLLAGPGNETGARLDPRGDWIAYESDESGTGEIYCRRIAGGPAYRMSDAGGANPRWLPDGSALLYRTQAGAVRRVGMPPSDAPVARTLFTQPGLASFDLDPSGRRILCAVEAAAAVPSQLTVILDWPAWMKANR